VFIPPSAATLGSRPGENQLRDVLRELLAAISGLCLFGPKDGLVWRGQSDASWALRSSVTRSGRWGDDIRAYEVDLIERTRRVGADGAQHLADWEILARLRHHGAATRLIDVTADPYVALWFASDVAKPSDGLVLAVSRSRLATLDKPWTARYDAYVKPSDGVSYLYQVAALDPRISAQRGLFLFSSAPRDGFAAELDDLTSPPRRWNASKLQKICGESTHAGRRGRPVESFPKIMAVRVPALVKGAVRKFLERSFGYTTDSLFPDFPGLGEANSLEPFK
jgi:hypothetical protein